ncbi:MAG: SLBB domain-containing protein [Deltaproteobacteria bacterium]|nr:SLBB domain-containing protein [Deltaproteobacteria bacterium]
MRGLLFLLGLSWAGAATATDYQLGVDDEIEILVHGESDISRTALITRTCTVDVHFLGPVEVCGKTSSEVAQAIGNGLRTNGYLVNPYVVVDVVKYGSHVIEVAGQVKNPGATAIAGPTSLSQAIAKAGGPASPNVLQVRVIRGEGQQVEQYYLPDLDTMSTPILVDAGDRIVLLEPLNVYLSGEVNRQGTVPFREGMTVTEALSMAGGPTDFAGLSRAYVLRANGEKVRVNLRKVSRGELADFVLHPEDQVIIRRSVF